MLGEAGLGRPPKEIVRYIDGLKTERSIDRNVERALDFLLGKGRFVGRDRP